MSSIQRSDYHRELLRCLEAEEWNDFIWIAELSKGNPHLLNDANSDFVRVVCKRIWDLDQDEDEEDDLPTAVSDAFISSCVANDEREKVILITAACIVGASDRVIEPLLNIDPATFDSERLCPVYRNPLRFAVSRAQPDVNTVEKLVKTFPLLAKLSDSAERLPIDYAAHCLDDSSRAGMIVCLLDAHPDGALVSPNRRDADPLTSACDHFRRKGLEAEYPNLFMRRFTHSVRSGRVDADTQYRLLCCIFLLLTTTKSSWIFSRQGGLGELPPMSLLFPYYGIGPNGDLKWIPVDAATEIGSRCPLDLLHFLLAIHFEDPRRRDREGRLSLHVIAASAPRRDELGSWYGYMYNDDEGEDETGDSSFLQRALRSFPNAAKVADNQGRLPLHIHAGARGPASDDMPPTYDLEILLRAFPVGAKTRDTDGRLPLHYAISGGRAWSEGTMLLFQAYPEAIETRDPETGLFAFMMAAANGACHLDTVYCLLKADPALVRSGIKDRN